MNNTDDIITMYCSAEKPWVLAFMWIPLDIYATNANWILDQVDRPHGTDTRAGSTRYPKQEVVEPMEAENSPSHTETLH